MSAPDLARSMGITPHQARYRQSLIQERARARKQALIDGRCKVGTSTRKSPRKKGDAGAQCPRTQISCQCLFLAVRSRIQAARKQSPSPETVSSTVISPNESASPTPYWSYALAMPWTPGVPWQYEIVQTPAYNTEHFRTFDTLANEEKYIDPSFLDYTESKS